MEKDTIIKIGTTLLLAVYLVVALVTTTAAERAECFTGVNIVINDSIGSGFVSEMDVAAQCRDLHALVANTPRGSVDMDSLERLIASMPVVERANVASLCNGTLQVDVKPMVPVARVFNPSGDSYYINSLGKRVPATARHHVDVPVVVGDFDRAGLSPETLLPMLSYIAADPTLDALVSTVALSPRGDIILVPAIRGQVINFGDTSSVANKFARLKNFYRNIIAVRGWNTYDTVSVKWANQVVASRREKSLNKLALGTEESEFAFIDDISTMTPDADGIVAGADSLAANTKPKKEKQI